MKIYIRNGRKYVRSRNGRRYPYKVVVAATVALLIISGILLCAGLILIIAEPTVEDNVAFIITMIVKTIIGFVCSYVGYKGLEVSQNILRKL